jgi:hypothetical protein
MTTREKFKRTIIELIHDLPYEEAILEELKIPGCLIKTSFLEDDDEGIEDTECLGFVTTSKWLNFYDSRDVYYGYIKNHAEELKRGYSEIHEWYYSIKGAPITIGRVMQAFKNKNIALFLSLKNVIAIHNFNKNEGERETDIEWRLIKENGQECTDYDQSDETIEALLQLIEDGISEYENSK